MEEPPMSSPTFGSDQPGPDQTHPQGSPPPPPQGQPDWGAAPPPPAQQGYGAPAGYGSSAGLGAPAGYGAVTGQRPPQVLVAAQGKNSTILKIAGLVTAGLALLGLVLALTQGSFDFSSLLLIAAGVGIFVLLNQPVSQQWFASRGAR